MKPLCEYVCAETSFLEESIQVVYQWEMINVDLLREQPECY